MSPRTDRAEIASLPTSFGPVEIMRTSYRQQTFSKHSHDYWTVGVMLEGRGTLWYRGAEHVSAAGDVVVIPPDEIHTGGVGRGAEVLSYLALHVPPSLLSAAAAHAVPDAERIAILSPVVQNPVVAALLHRLGAHASSNDGSTIDALLTRLLQSLLAPASSVTPTVAQPALTTPHFVRAARDIIEACYADSSRTSLGALSRSTGVTPFHLVREFTASTGLSPHRYLVQTRVRRASDLLATGMPVSLVAASTGFADQSHLTTQFKRYVGMTPAAYRSARVRA
jgi:AraC-like DNA-binding protein/mannose-6-phosphate isomerase-like protein (cupin superfamily)